MKVIPRSKMIAGYAVCLTVLHLLAGCSAVSQKPDPWQQVDEILKRIQAPVFPDKDFDITQYGAKGDGATECTNAFRKAIEECSRSGGGRVVVPNGEFLTGAIHLKSNVNLHLAEGAVIKFHRDPKKYLPLVFSRWEGVECMNYSPLIYAFEQENIAVTGKGVLDGQATNEHWWYWKGKKEFGWKEGLPEQTPGRNLLFEMGEKGVPVGERILGEGYYLRPSFIQPYRSKNILIEGIKIINSPMWEIHPVLCENVTIRNVHIDTHGPNNDGCNPESSRDVLIEDSYFDTGDDCIAIKAGRNNDGRRVATPSENIVIRRCVFKDGHGGITIGSEMTGGVRNVFAKDCEFESPVLYNALRVKTNAVRGGIVENIHLRNMHVRLVGRAVVDIDLFYEEGREGNFLPTIRSISIERMTVDSCRTALNLVGYEEAPLRDIRLVNCVFKEVAKGYKIEHVVGMEAVNTTINGNELKP
ncbi:MAG: glycoside hydrolase family 28 protein [Bacteroidetes bacterium]|nr:glycoside hydrolase family 28 protein [Bacteroidota bacterium]